MLSQEKNKRLTEVGPGTAMGDYLRRYWHPIAGVSEFDEKSVRPIRLFGEDLVLYKDLSGNYGLVQRRCPHRNADLAFGIVEQCGLRCAYHGWEFGRDGACTHQPFEEIVDPTARLRQKTRITAYEVRAKAGLLWAYMGPLPAPELPDWEPFSYEHGFAQVVMAEIPCNWFQCQENSIDPVHFEWTHNNWTARQQDAGAAYVPTHLKAAYEEFEHGFVYKRLRAAESEENVMWTVGRVTLWPNGFYLGHHFEWRVPIDDENTLSVFWVFNRVPKEQEPYVQTRIPTWYGPLYDENGDWITSHVANQDFAAWVGQGRITDRSKETLGASDRGIVMMRRKFFEELEAVAGGAAPKGLITDPAKNARVFLPSACREEMLTGLTREALSAHPLLGPYLHDFFGQAGQPDDVREAYEQAVGQKMRGAKFFTVHGAGEAQGDEADKAGKA
ncbi:MULTISPECIES: aromatic ring-hydroxylating dioxygenase subunit alpha [Pandoraea]|uniref:aromatic ring-hydroxylating dioxygenase subunit alpha n=1 Tax=Pandoraea TaxID=93217 RepID=UPI001F5C7B60|nr:MULTISPECIES: aromatic ring-hydroxylating dioxygenase subunit alpha [Pandoraea]MCI3203891.1 aromatic ring-hydroxylating dioxygenase subunit alpha [Pandoraea sp. LA3]MDN4581917.1 aromatic ring-hydroxylating dioxygenase subunit alpha [Pandoraea capi]